MKFKAYTCIYCKRQNKKPGREHVIPEAFGTFGDQTPVLHCVCADCNQAFSGQFEQAVYRGSWEGLQRYKYGLKSPAATDDIISRRARLNIRGGELNGLRLNPITNNAESQIEVKRRDNGEAVQFTLDDLKRLGPSDAKKLYDFSQLKMAIWDPSHRKLFVEELRRLGFMTTTQTEPVLVPMPAGTKLPGTFTFSMDTKTARAMAKIAFNYMAYQFGSALALHPQFDEIRAFIMTGIWTDRTKVHAVGMQENATRPRPENVYHLITLHLDQNSIVYGRVALFSGHTYHIALSMTATPATVPKELLSGLGHYYSFQNATVKPVPRRLLDRRIALEGPPL